VSCSKADEVWLIPCGPRPDKPSLKTPAIHRLIMCHLAVNSSFGSTFPMKVNDIEIQEGRALSTYELMSRLKEGHPEINFVFVIGSVFLF
jgi:nicotinic acid mononucleotide adenylyltransferase